MRILNWGGCGPNARADTPSATALDPVVTDGRLARPRKKISTIAHQRAPFRRTTAVLASAFPLCVLGACSAPNQTPVQAIEILAHGIMEYGSAPTEKDQSSSIGAEITRSPAVKIVTVTDHIPLRVGISYGISFVVKGSAVADAVPVTVVLKTSYPCVLRSTGAVVYQNDTILNVRIGVPRYVGARIVTGVDSPCVDPPGPGVETFEVYYDGKKYAEQRFSMLPDNDQK